jgi:hypothetical protein
VPYEWSFAYYEKDERARIFNEAEAWLTQRKSAEVPVSVLAQSERMILVALHQPEAGECNHFQ